MPAGQQHRLLAYSAAFFDKRRSLFFVGFILTAHQSLFIARSKLTDSRSGLCKFSLQCGPVGFACARLVLSFDKKGIVMKLAAFKLLVVGWLAALAMPVHAAPDGEITYEVKRNDTLIGLTNRYFINRAALRQVQTRNKITNPRRIPIGKRLKIPRRLLKFRDVDLVVQSFKGSVSVRQGERAITPSVGLALREGAEITTRANSFVSIGGEGNSRLSIPSNSRIRLIDARRYVINNQIDVQIRVLKGRGEVIAPKIRGEGRFRVGTPLAVTAVRGTEFRVAFEPDAEISLSEILEGQVTVAAGGEETSPAAGFGVASAGETLGEQEKLLAAPELVDGGRIQTDENVSFAINPVEGASAYRTQIARDAGFIEVITEQVTPVPLVVFEQIEDARYFVRSRPIAKSGLEGFSRTYSFRRKRAGAEAGAEPAPFADAFKFAWRAQGTGDAVYAFQLWNAASPGELLVDEVAITDSAIILSSLPAGEYRWRVATFEVDEGDVIKVWTSPQELSVSE